MKRGIDMQFVLSMLDVCDNGALLLFGSRLALLQRALRCETWFCARMT